ncbi:MAG: radical SAM protein [Alphaproteobacteria bacterium]|nr:radical SAM protein [Alphaproteobacteria bacterium]
MDTINPAAETNQPVELVVDGPLLVFGGCYSNLEATLALRVEAERLGIPPQRTICTGDVVAYGADPVETVALVRDWGIHVVMGNCEESLGSAGTDCGCGFAEGSVCADLAAAWYTYADQRLGEADRAWMRARPRRLYVRLGGRRLAIVHGSVERINGFIFASTSWTEKSRQIVLAACDGIIGGHAGVPFTELREGKLWHNAGSIGMPANDGTRRVWYSLLISTPAGVEIRSIPFDYDAVAATCKIRAAGLPEGYAAALETGLWPSCDILPNKERAATGQALQPHRCLWNSASGADAVTLSVPPSAHAKFSDPDHTANGERRAGVGLKTLETVWFNTGTLCNITCDNCYIESSPRNDRLVYLSRTEVRRFLDEASARDPRPMEIGFTGGEPFMNPGFLGMLEDSLIAGFRVLVLTNAMKPMQRARTRLAAINRRFAERLTVRVSLDHYARERHERLRGPRSWQPALDGMLWLARNGFNVAVAGRTVWSESEAALRAGYGALFAELGVAIDADDPARLVLFPEMDSDEGVPEITERCWNVLGKSPDSVMCASARMVIKRKGAERPTVVACTLLPYDRAFELGATLAEAARPVKLNHRHCAQFCVLGGASCSAQAVR